MLSAPILLLVFAAAVGSEVPLGTSLRTIYAQEIIDPDPAPGIAGRQPGSDGSQAAGAAERYRTDKVKKPVSVRTSKSITDSGGSQ
jgi:hypothetical protein